MSQDANNSVKDTATCARTCLYDCINHSCKSPVSIVMAAAISRPWRSMCCPIKLTCILAPICMCEEIDKKKLSHHAYNFTIPDLDACLSKNAPEKKKLVPSRRRPTKLKKKLYLEDCFTTEVGSNTSSLQRYWQPI